MTCSCYKHSLTICPDNTTILIEYGTFAYCIHSFCSRLLKQVYINNNLKLIIQNALYLNYILNVNNLLFITCNKIIFIFLYI